MECLLLALDDRAHIQSDPHPVVSQGAGQVCMGERYPSGWMSKRNDLGDTRHQGVPQIQQSWSEAMGHRSPDTWFYGFSMFHIHGLVLMGRSGQEVAMPQSPDPTVTDFIRIAPIKSNIGIVERHRTLGVIPSAPACPRDPRCGSTVPTISPRPLTT